MSDPRVRVDGKVGYTVIRNGLLPGGEQISARAWGVFAYLMSRPPGWEARASQMTTVFKEGRDAIYKALRELCDVGLVRKEVTIENGLRRERYVLDEEAAIERSRRSAPDTPFQDAGDQEPENPHPEKAGQVTKEGITKEVVTTETTSSRPDSVETKPKRDPNEGREDVDRLCAYLSERLTALDVKHNPNTRAWRDAARLMIDADGRTEEKIRNAIEWALGNDFWHRNMHSMPTLRRQYDKIRLDAKAELKAKNGTGRRPANLIRGTDEDTDRIITAWEGTGTNG